MARYVDGYVLPIPRKNLPAYRKMTRLAAKIWREHGALEYCEAAGEDLAPAGPFLPFPRAMKCKPGETVVFVYLHDYTRSELVQDLWYQVRKKVGDIKGDLPQGEVGPSFNDEYGDVYSAHYIAARRMG